VGSQIKRMEGSQMSSLVSSPVSSWLGEGGRVVCSVGLYNVSGWKKGIPRFAFTTLPVSLARAVQRYALCAARALNKRNLPVVASRSESEGAQVSLEAEWVVLFKCKVKGESLWTLKVVFTSRHVANVPTAPSDRSFQRFPCPSTAPQQPDAA
jgi:hypothetical protein